VAARFIGGGNQSIRRKPQTCHKSLTNLITCVFSIYSQVDITDEVREYLRKPTFDNWQWDDPEMLILLRQMYIDLKLVSNLNIEVKI
jgi:high affinity cGMP-specific 3',5'-cyclic phosphodiesterase 9